MVRSIVRSFIIVVGMMLVVPAFAQTAPIRQNRTVRLTTDALRDKIKGAGPGRPIGVTFGGPTEFRYRGTMIDDYTPIAWNDTLLKESFEHTKGLYDDMYVDLDVRERDREAGPRRVRRAVRRRLCTRRLSALACQSDGALQHPAGHDAAGVGRLAEQSRRRRHRLPDRIRFHRPHVAGHAGCRRGHGGSCRSHHELRRRVVRRRLHRDDVFAGVRIHGRQLRGDGRPEVDSRRHPVLSDHQRRHRSAQAISRRLEARVV